VFFLVIADLDIYTQHCHCNITKQVGVMIKINEKIKLIICASVVAYSTLQLTLLLIVGIVTQGLGI
jgi:hypothetical protein